FLSLEIRSDDMAHVIMRQQYEFAAAHRLHCRELSDEKNREVFGKCNNPSGHGHNYRLEVTIRVPISPTGQIVRPEQLDAVVDTHVIEKLDHKNLSIDVPEFATRNSSVENIAQVVYGLLEAPLAEVLRAELVEVR